MSVMIITCYCSYLHRGNLGINLNIYNKFINFEARIGEKWEYERTNDMFHDYYSVEGMT